jgi:hypothetical protein
MIFRITTITSLALIAVACGGGGDTQPINTPDAPTQSSTPYTHYVTNDLTIGSTPAEALALAFDLDNDAQHRPDNALGGILVGLNIALGVDINSALSDALTAGDFVILHSMHGDLTSAASATWQIYLGDPKATPDLTSGNGMFTIAATSPTTSVFNGHVTGGLFDGTSSKISIQIALIAGSEPLKVDLVAAKIEAQVTATGCMAGRIGGGITHADLEAVVIPAIAAQLTANYHNHNCPNGTACTANDKAIFATLDANHDGTLTAAEIIAYPVISGALAPDVHLLDSNTSAGPDSNSIAFGFGCTKAVFTASGEH